MAASAARAIAMAIFRRRYVIAPRLSLLAFAPRRVLSAVQAET
jgi:hypothetical protein